jgi:hypothetical protein
VLFILPASWLGMVALSILLIIFSFSLTYKQFYNLKWFKAIWKGIIVYLLSYIAQLIIMFIALFIYMSILKSRQ